MTITLKELVDREVLVCVSGLVSDLARMMQHVPGNVQRDLSFDEDDLYRLMVRDDWETPAEWHIDHDMRREELVDALLSIGDTDGDGHEERYAEMLEVDLRQELCAMIKDQDLWRQFCEDRGIDPEQNEAYEHWIVTDWLAARLKEKGEIVGDLGYLTVWGRCTTGQAISMDWVMQQIYKDLTGQEGEI